MSYTTTIAEPTRSVGKYGVNSDKRVVGQRSSARYDAVQDKQQREFEAEFQRLAREWRSAVQDISSAQDMVSHPSYLKIIGKGPRVIPYILTELDRAPDHWFVALEAIAGENPIKPQQRGDIFEMKQAWLNWAQREGYA